MSLEWTDKQKSCCPSCFCTSLLCGISRVSTAWGMACPCICVNPLRLKACEQPRAFHTSDLTNLAEVKLCHGFPHTLLFNFLLLPQQRLWQMELTHSHCDEVSVALDAHCKVIRVMLPVCQAPKALSAVSHFTGSSSDITRSNCHPGQ